MAAWTAVADRVFSRVGDVIALLFHVLVGLSWRVFFVCHNLSEYMGHAVRLSGTMTLTPAAATLCSCCER